MMDLSHSLLCLSLPLSSLFPLSRVFLAGIIIIGAGKWVGRSRGSGGGGFPSPGAPSCGGGSSLEAASGEKERGKRRGMVGQRSPSLHGGHSDLTYPSKPW